MLIEKSSVIVSSKPLAKQEVPKRLLTRRKFVSEVVIVEERKFSPSVKTCGFATPSSEGGFGYSRKPSLPLSGEVARSAGGVVLLTGNSFSPSVKTYGFDEKLLGASWHAS